jgi:serine/threonine protein kinase
VPRLPRGATLGRYVVLDCLGSGGMGVVYVAHDFALDRRVSLKLLRPSGKDPEGRRERLVSEAQALARVSHPNVLTVHDVGTWEDEVYLALEHVEGETLLSWLDRAPHPAEDPRDVPPGRAGAQVSTRGLIHRDVKPRTPGGARRSARVADLGLAITTGSAPARPARPCDRAPPGTCHSSSTGESLSTPGPTSSAWRSPSTRRCSATGPTAAGGPRASRSRPGWGAGPRSRCHAPRRFRPDCAGHSPPRSARTARSGPRRSCRSSRPWSLRE